MGRPNKTGVDYFSHDTRSGKTIFTLESKYGNDGYAFWFKLLELLGSQDGLYIDCNNSDEWEYLLAKTRVDEVSASEILELLSNLKAIDTELWNQKIIWCQKFVDRLEATIYRKRTTEIPQKPSFRVENIGGDDVSGEKSTQRKEKKSKEKKSKEKELVPYETIRDRFNEICTSLSKVISITEKRKAKIKARWDELKTVEAFENLFYLTEQSDFLCGRGKEWRCSFDWLMMNDTNYIKVLEGNYKNQKQSGNPFKEKLKEMVEDDQTGGNGNHVGYQGGLSKLLQKPDGG